MPFRPMARPPKAPAVSLRRSIWEVARPCAAVPAARPWARQSLMRARRKIVVQMRVPKMPVIMTNTAVRGGWPPRFWAMPMAMGVVTDLGPREMMT